MANVIDVLSERGFIEQMTHDQEMKDAFDTRRISCYIGFDPTASSFHIGSLVPIMSLAHMQRHGHRPIALVGGGTGLVGDPSGRTEMRQLLTIEAVEQNARGLRKQLSNFIDFSADKALMLNNADWLTKLEYIPFLRDIGRHFSVNRMIKTESCKIRLDSDEGLSFIEFNYMVLQAYDFLFLYEEHDCTLQMGGSDQWGNIVAGIDLIRRMRQGSAYGLTFPLIATSSGVKMGKTAKGAIWLDSDLTSPYEYYQYWINTDDRDVTRFLALFTFLPMNEIEPVERLEGSQLNVAKTVLAFEATQLAHGKKEALKAYQAASSMFGNRDVPENILPSSTVPRGETTEAEASVPRSIMTTGEFQEGIPAFKLFYRVDLAPSGGAARRLIEQGGAYINGWRIDAFDYQISVDDVQNGEILLRSGKKRIHKITIK